MKRIAGITDAEITGGDKLSAKPPRRAARAAFFRDGRLALMYSAQWELYMLPGGGIEQGEGAREAAVREALEETGCHIELTDELGYIYENRGEYDFTQYSYYFVARITGRDEAPHLTEDENANGLRLVWAEPDEAIRLVLRPKHTREQRLFIQRRELLALVALKQYLSSHTKSDILG